MLLCVFSGLRYFEKRNVFKPSPHIELRPEDLGLEHEEVRFNTEDGVELFAWLFRDPKARATFIFCHGNRGNIANRFEVVRLLKGLKVNIFVFDYRGYGFSKGSVSEEGTYKDVVAAFEYVRTDDGLKDLPIVVYGESLGGAISIELALRRKPDAVIVDSTFTSIEDMSKDLFPFLPVKLVGKIKYNSIGKINRLNMPVLIIHSRQDELINFKHGRRLFEKAAQPKEFFERLGSHNEGVFVNPDAYRERINAFLDRHVFL